MIGLYRSGQKLEQFMRGCNVDFAINGMSRFPALVDCLLKHARDPDGDTILRTIIERAADPRDFITEPEKLIAVIEYLNKFLAFDGLQLQHQGTTIRLTNPG